MNCKFPLSRRTVLGPLTVVVCALFLLTATAEAAVTISGTVKDNTGAAVVGALVQVIDPASQQTVASTQTNSNGAYSLSVDPGTYDVRVIPPAGSIFQSAI